MVLNTHVFLYYIQKEVDKCNCKTGIYILFTGVFCREKVHFTRQSCTMRGNPYCDWAVGWMFLGSYPCKNLRFAILHNAHIGSNILIFSGHRVFFL